MNGLLVLPVAVAGTVLGSFTATAAIRYARGEGFLGGRSHCDECGATLGFAATVPLASYVGFGGAARCCRGRIDPLHPAGELAGLVIALAAAAPGDLTRDLLVAGVGFCLLALTLIDLRTSRLPDPLVAATAVGGLLLSALAGVERLLAGVVAAGTAFLILEALRRAFLRFRGRGGLGGGDVKLLAALGLWLGAMTPLALALAALLGLLQVTVLRPKDGRIAFGPALAFAGFAAGLAKEFAPTLWGLG